MKPKAKKCIICVFFDVVNSLCEFDGHTTKKNCIACKYLRDSDGLNEDRAVFNTKQIKTVEELYDLATKGKSVFSNYYETFKKPKPAAFVICMQANRVVEYIQRGLYVYTPKQKKSFSVDIFKYPNGDKK